MEQLVKCLNPTQMTNHEVAQVFFTIADLLEIKGEVIYKVMAYRQAAQSILDLGQDIEAVWRAGQLHTIPGVGKAIARKIDELLRTGRLGYYEQLKAEIPPTLVDVLRVPDVGPKKTALFWKALGITTLAQLEEAARAGRLRTLPGIGEKTEAKILKNIESLRGRTERIPLGVAWQIAQAFLEALARVPGVVHVAAGGSLRRMRDTIGDIDLLVATNDPEAVMDAFVSHPHVASVVMRGPTRASVLVHRGQQVDIRVLPPERWGTLLQYFTGSIAHNIHLRSLAQDMGLSLSEYALTRPDGSEILCATEEEVYRALGLPWIPPELREDRGEIEAALAGELPQLVQAKDIRGDLQMHTTWSDGSASVAEMAAAAAAKGLEYILISDHSPSLGVARGLSAERLHQQWEEIAAVNAAGGPVRVLRGAEVEIHNDGSLDYPDDVLASLDIVVAALHTGLRQPRQQVTRRLLAAIANPHVDIIAHPSGRLMGEREPADLDMEAIFQAAAQAGTILEINADPHRLDLDDGHAHRALQLGVKLAINSDAHDPDAVGNLRFGLGIARRAWATPADIVNTWPLEKLLEYVRQRSTH